MLTRLLRVYLRPYASVIALIVVLQLIQAVGNLTLPSLNADIIDNGVAKGDTGYILRTGVVMLVVTLIQAAAAITAVYFGARTAMAVGRDVRSGLFERVQTFSAREVARFGTHSLITRTTNDVQQVQMLVLMTFTIAITAPMVMIGGVIMALRQDVRLSGLLLVVVPVLLGVILALIPPMRRQFRLVQKRIDRINRVLREQISGIRVIRAFVREDTEGQRFAVANDELMDTSIRVGRLMALMFPIVMLIINVSSVAVFWFGGRQVDAGDMEIGGLVAFLSYLMQILFSLMMATMVFMMVPRAEVCADRINEVLGTESSVATAAEPVRVLREHGDLELREVSFTYPGAESPVLEDVSLHARAGETTAIIGSTGSGKSTLLGLIPRLYDATAGQVLVDGVDVRDLDPQLLWSRIGLVPQQPYLFSGTIASNLRYGKEDATEDEIWEALRVAQAADFVSTLEEGLDAPVAQGGTNFSGGQRQRLAIARALMKKPEIYLFDDSFSALDFATDARLRAALVPFTRKATVVIVAQRVSTILHADRIVVLDGGRVVGVGAHPELMETNETYREIVLSQLTEEEAA
jgi:ATP-binding cassette subfamily B multidrug efflux pump